jgi:hypothetical protein
MQHLMAFHEFLQPSLVERNCTDLRISAVRTCTCPLRFVSFGYITLLDSIGILWLSSNDNGLRAQLRSKSLELLQV